MNVTLEINDRTRRVIMRALMSEVQKAQPGTYKLTFRKDNKRTGQQNRLYWKRQNILATEMGYAAEELHEHAMKICGFTKEVSVMGVTDLVRLSSTELNTKEFSVLIEWQDRAVQWLNEDRDEKIELPGVE